MPRDETRSQNHLLSHSTISSHPTMPVTELALLRILPPHGSTSPEVLSNLSASNAALYSYNRKSFIFFQQVEDPSYVYIFGDWESAREHYDHFVPSEPNQRILERLRDKVEVVWLQHFGVSREDLPLEVDDGAISIGRHYVRQENKVAFEKIIEEKKRFLDAYVTRGTPKGGWKLEWDGEGAEKNKVPDQHGEEWVLISPWADVAEHTGFAETEAFKEYMALRELLEGADIKHARRLVVE